MGSSLSHPISSKVLHRHGHAHAMFGTASMNGYRVTNEDRHGVKPCMDKHPLISYCAVYDGHSGQEAAEYCSSNIPPTLEALQDPTVPKELAKALVGIDLTFKTVASSAAVGTTAVIALVKASSSPPSEAAATAIDEEEEHKKVQHFDITIANIGDSRAMIIYTDGKHLALTKDHKPALPRERDRIRNAGGKVIGNRVDGSLAMSRAIGDFQLKDTPGRGPLEQKVIPLADVTVEKAQKGDLLLLCCDGLFEKMTNAEVATFVHDKYKELPTDPALVAAALCDESLKRGSKDNMSVVLVALGCDGTRYAKEPQYIPVATFQGKKPNKRTIAVYRKEAAKYGFAGAKFDQLVDQAVNVNSAPK